MKVVSFLEIKNINHCLNKFYLEYISIGIHNNMNDDGYPPAKIPIHQLNTYNIGTQIPREKATTEQLSMLHAEKSKHIITKLLQNMTSF